MKLHRRGALVRVTWVDSESMEGWQDLDSLDSLSNRALRCISVGYVVKHRKDRLTLTSSWHGKRRKPPEVMAPITIPAVAIRKIELLEP